MSPPFLIIGNPENRRIAAFQDALTGLQLSPGHVVAYVDILANRTSLSAHLKPGMILRIESPGENFDVERGLLQMGIAEAESEGTPVISAREISKQSFDRGLILHPRQAYLGFRKLLRQLADEIATVPDLRLMNVPSDVEVMFDKRQCYERFQKQGVPVPPSLGPVACYEELVARMQDTGEQRVFLKLANGSSASGVVAFYRGASHSVAITSAEMVRDGGNPRLYNSLNIRCYTRQRDQKELIDTLCREHVHVERWLPKLVLDQHGNLDLRIVVIGGEARHWVIRQGRSPLTNLHLGNRRGNREQFLERIGMDRWNALKQTCIQVMESFPESLYAGVDLLVMPNLSDHAVLEVNAFGDLLPNVHSEGMDTYTAEIQAILSQEEGD